MAPWIRPPATRVNRCHCGLRGFTLIEMLVAVAVLAALAAVSFRGLDAILSAERNVQAETRRWNDVAAVVAQMDRDLSHAAARPARDGAGAVAAAVALERPARMLGQILITRLGDGDGGEARADLRRIGYRLNAGTLEYLVWPTADLAPDASPSVHAILEDVVQFQLRALDADGSWVSAWPERRPADALPRAIEAQFEFAGGERISRIFAVR